MPPTLESLDLKLNRAIASIEITARRVEGWDDKISRVAALEQVAAKLTGVSWRLMLLPARWGVALGVCAFFGGLVGTLLWQFMHPVQALASTLGH